MYTLLKKKGLAEQINEDITITYVNLKAMILKEVAVEVISTEADEE